jgi:hypothetical protein
MAASSCTSMTGVSSSVTALASSKSGVLNGASVAAPSARSVAVFFNGKSSVSSLCCRAKMGVDQDASSSVGASSSPAALPRRLALTLLAGVIAAGSRAAPANAAYGESANIFGTPKVDTGFVLKSFDGFKLEVPAKWNPSSEREFPGQILKYEDNFDSVSNFTVSVTPSSKTSIKDYGSPEKFLEEVSYLLGKQSYSGLTQSEVSLLLSLSLITTNFLSTFSLMSNHDLIVTSWRDLLLGDIWDLKIAGRFQGQCCINCCSAGVISHRGEWKALLQG